MSREKTDFWVGLFVLLGAIALVFLALRAGNLSTFSFAPTYTLSANFDNVGGLKPRAAVKSAGVVGAACPASPSTTRPSRRSYR